MSINLAFGNPNREFLSTLKEENYLDSLLPELKNYPPPGYDSPEQEQEINEIISMCNNLQSDESTEQRYLYYDTDFDKYIVGVMSSAGIPKAEVEELINSLKAETAPLMMKLKYHYQRIRPLQLSLYFNLPLYPYISKTALTPSYPSGHTYQAKIYCEVLGNRYPKYYQSLQKLAEDIGISRIYLGVHYPSDIEFAKYCADLVVNHPDFKLKYKL
jgi:hypothetical protein